MSDFRVEHATQDDPPRLVVTGELDVATAPELEAALRASLGVPGGDLVLDLRPLEFIDSSGLRAVLVGARDAAAAERGLRVVVCDGGQVERVFGLAGVADRLDLMRDGDSLPDAAS